MRALWIASGALVWAVHFTAIYAIASLACARSLGISVPGVIAGVTLLAVALCVFIAARSLRRRAEFIEALAAMVAGTALIAIVWEALPVMWLPICSG
jgi:putative effector of murein hydrolase LrgA (UPF0299 family)